jgi:hypothetical protein
MTVEEMTIPVLDALITDTTKTLVLLSVGPHFEKKKRMKIP